MAKRNARILSLIASIGLIVYFSYINRPILLAFIEISGLNTAVLYEHTKSISNDMEAAPFKLDGFRYLVSVRNNPDLNKNGFRFFDANHRETGFFQSTSTLPSALVVGNDLLVTATNYDKEKLESQISLFRFEKGHSRFPYVQTVIASTWTSFFNSSLAYDPQRGSYVLAYEIDEPGLFPFSIRFLTSNDLKVWKKVEFTFHPDEYAACPTIRVINGVYYLWYLEKLKYSRIFVTRIARSHDLINWEVSKIAFLSPRKEDGINASDFDYINVDGRSHMFYAAGDQLTNGSANIRYAIANFEIDKVVDAFFDADPYKSLGKFGVKTRTSLDLINFVASDAFAAGIKLLPAEGSIGRYWGNLATRLF